MKMLTTIIIWMIAQGVLAAGISMDPGSGIDMGGSPITNLDEPVFPGDAAPMDYLQEVLTGVAPVEKTGQTTSYASGDDGDLERGAPWPNPRLTDNQDGTVTDNLTGLVWLAKANCIATDYPGFDTDGTAGDGLVDWSSALEFVAGINTADYDCSDTSNGGGNQTDWRLPNVKELHSLIDFSKSNPALPDSGLFQDMQSNWYWSSTTVAQGNHLAWAVSLLNGDANHGDKVYVGLFVWPVRAGN